MDSIVRFLFTFLSLYFLVIASYTELVNFAPWNFYSVYTLVLLSCLAIITLTGFLRTKNDSSESNLKLTSFKNLALIGIIVLLWFLIRYDVFVHGLIWFDEATQYIPYWSFTNSVDSVKYAALQQQMPLDYYTSYAFLSLFGANPDAMLFHSRIYGILSCAVLFLILLRLNFNWFILLLAMVVFMSELTILRYSSEARPIGLVILLGLIHFYYINKYLKSSDNKIIFELLPSSLLFMLSTALQPVLHLFVLTFYFKLKTRNQVKNKMLDYNFLLSLLLCAPLVWHIYSSTAGHVPNFKSQDIKSTLFDLFTNFNFHNMTVFVNQFNHLFFMLILFALMIYTLKKLMTGGDQRSSILNWIYIVIFPPLFLWIWSIMDWTVYPRYFVIWTVVSIILLFQMLNDAVIEYSRKLNKYALVLFGAVVILMTVDYSVAQHRIHMKDKVSDIPDIRSVFAFENKEVNTIYFYLPLKHPKNSSYYLDYLGPFYNSTNRYFWLDNRKSLFHQVPKVLRPDLEPLFNQFEKFNFDVKFDLFVIVDCGIEVINPYCEFNPVELSIGSAAPFVAGLGGSNKVFIYRDQEHIIKSFELILSILEKKMQGSVWLFDYYFLKISHLLHIKEYPTAKEYIFKLKNLLSSSDFENYFEKNRLLETLDVSLKRIESESRK